MKGRPCLFNLVVKLIALVVCFAGVLVVAAGVSESADIRDTIVKLYVVKSIPNYDTPWDNLSPQKTYSSGAIIEGNMIITSAHSVEDHSFVQVRRHGKPDKVTARVLYIGYLEDLALLTVDDPEFFEGVEPLSIGELPHIGQPVTVYGFPEGGERLSTNKGVVSRIDFAVYSHSYSNLPAIQIDAPINFGNSGAPVIIDGKMAGIVFQRKKRGENMGYMVPPTMINRFLKDVEDGRYDVIPRIGFKYQRIENRAMKEYYKLGDKKTGVLVVKIAPGSPAEGRLHVGDIITAVDGHKIANDGSIELRPGDRIGYTYIINLHQMGEPVVFDVLRNGKTVKLTLLPAVPPYLIEAVPYYHDRRPSYFIYGGIVFTPLTVNFLKTWGRNWFNSAPKWMTSALLNKYKQKKGEELVVAGKILPSEVNKGYENVLNDRIVKVNGEEILNLRDLIDKVEKGKNRPFTVFESEKGTRVIIDNRKAEETRDEIFKTYRVPADRSEDLI
ncbi:MAG: PDZ domain-containing protein [Nitrospirae bacterium]|nr:MAG: PDZ domain-containing protein [Nitrospirota bacterium]